MSGKETDTSIEIWRNAVDGDVRNYEQFRGEAGNDFIDGRGGYDEVSYTTSPTGLTIDLRSNSVDDGFGTSDTINNIKVLRDQHNDIIVGNDADNSLDGRFGNNHIDGGDGFDFVEYNGSGRENVIVNLLTGEASFDKAGGSEQYQDTLLNIEGVIGSTNDDIITGNHQGNYLFGASGSDQISGLSGSDVLIGGDGADTLSGGAGDDELYGEAGIDTYIYRFEDGHDIISDDGENLLHAISRTADGTRLYGEMYIDDQPLGH